MWFGIHDKVLNFHDWTLCYHELCYHWICDIQIIWKLSYLSFWTLTTLNYVDCIPFSCIDFSIWLKIKPNNAWSTLHPCEKGPIKSVLFICPSVCRSVCLSHIFLRTYPLDFLNFLHEDVFAIYTKKWQSQVLENCICCLDNWVNKTFEPKVEYLTF